MANYKVVETKDKIGGMWLISELFCDEQLFIRADPNYIMYILQNVMQEEDTYQEVYKSGRSSDVIGYERLSRSWPKE